jgi:hypothetical protein
MLAGALVVRLGDLVGAADKVATAAVCLRVKMGLGAVCKVAKAAVWLKVCLRVKMNLVGAVYKEATTGVCLRVKAGLVGAVLVDLLAVTVLPVAEALVMYQKDPVATTVMETACAPAVTATAILRILDPFVTSFFKTKTWNSLRNNFSR